MRTTVEITREQHRALAALAQKRGIRGFSTIVQEAVAEYLSDREADELDLLLALEGVLSEDEEREMRGRIDQLRETWRT
jgi:metal-responsive CopG/Arc/MetJ family transcriptional regulator